MSSDFKEDLTSLLNDPEFKGTVAEELTTINYRNQQTAKLNRSKTCKETFMLVPSVIYASPNFYLIDELNEHISNLKSAGLIEYWHSKIFDDSILIAKHSEAPRTLKFQHLTGAFEFWLVGMAVSTAAFVHEMVRKRV